MLTMFGAEPSGFSVSLGLFLLFLVLLYWYAISPYSVLERCGIRHPKPVPFFGNMLMFRHDSFKAQKDLINQYGRVCGYYVVRRPTVVVADPDMLKQVMVKDFHKFPNRVLFRMATKPMKNSLIMLRDEQWKRVRSILTPTFSAAKMKEMVPLIHVATETLLNNLKAYAESGKSFDIHRCFGCFTMDVIASVAFGMQVDSQNNPNDPFVHHASKFFSFSLFRPFMFIFLNFPILIRPLGGLMRDKESSEMSNFFTTCIQKLIKQRDELQSSQRRRDFLQLMLDVRSSKECVSLDHFDVVNQADEQDVTDRNAESCNESAKSSQQKRMMTEDEIIGQAFIFFLAGYETSSNTLAFTCYLLAINPDCQKKVQKEVDDFFSRHGSADYTNIQELKYLDMVVCEALRLYPPAFRYARTVERECVVNGQLLPKGATLEIAAGFLHSDPEYWQEPEKFIPERFTPEAKASRHPFVYMPFGAGPRSCVGMRLAQLEIRMALVNILKTFNVVACKDTEVPLTLKSTTTLGPKNGVFVKITKRENFAHA
ncbi:thromboxane-A synthase isoform X1 [Ictalurus punctatus]|uniref:Thromboxane-A synthase n=2 Tax=Ictalurus punctatus TaxID=7998 RepID=A0A2D0QSF0_ICTPU|nr:thromboxane-A synthase isoform X1 [Ictalurus punctatus]XP_017321383.1 thromboxane-A synthase isoform X1 [Ictalurus punctatus]XP_017321384.1 thromboxane-A synthase isoform X1 [Ictalurus punctatus]